MAAVQNFDAVEEGIHALKNGEIIIVCDDEDRENEGDFIALADHATAETINFMVTHGRGLVCMPMTERRAQELKLEQMVEDNTDEYGTAFTVSVDHIETTTGISAPERAHTINALAAPEAEAEQFKRPGHIFPLVAKNGGVLRRAGHTEAAVDLARLADATPAGVICEIMNEDGSMARVPELRRIADAHNLKMITIQDLIHYRTKNSQLIKRAATITLPTDYGTFTLHAYESLVDNKEHLALVKGSIESDSPVLVRVHSECLTGDVFGSQRCDCGPQLDAALQKVADEGQGVVLYMRQEGRGIGLINKMKAYKLQEEGYDTVDANLALGFGADLRDYGIGAQILRDLGVTQMKLLTNNPRKITGLRGYGLEVYDRIPLELPAKKNNEQYLRTKQERLGHLLHL